MTKYRNTTLNLLTIMLAWWTLTPAFAYGSPLEKMINFLQSPKAKTHNLYQQPFMNEPLTAQQAEQAKQALLKSFEQDATAKWPALHQQITQRQIALNEITIPFTVETFGNKPDGGYSLYISLHDGGAVTAETNDKEWEKQQKRHTPAEGKYVTPHAPTNSTDMWYKPYMYDFFDQLIEGMILFEEVDPNKIYLIGYGVGGDGVYQIAPTMADRFAAASTFAGHSRNSLPLNLRNMLFQIQIGSSDDQENRYMSNKKYIQQLEAMNKKDPGGYSSNVKIHKDKGYEISDKDAIRFLSSIQRIPLPQKIVWQ